MDAAALKEACEHSGAVFALFWEYDEILGALKVAHHYNPPERVQKVKEELDTDRLYSTESYKFLFKPGEGVVGHVYQSGGPMFFLTAELPRDACSFQRQSSGENTFADRFQRGNLADKFGIKCIGMKPMAGGVLELGATDSDLFNWVHSEV